MSLVRGPFNITWGDNTLMDVSELSVDYSVDSEDYPTLQGHTFTIDGAHKVTATLKLLRSDIPALAALLPQYFVANGQRMSTGETVQEANGAIDVRAASCDVGEINNNLDIISCGNPGQVLRLVNTRTRIDSIDLDDKIQQVSIIFIGEATSEEAVIQFFKENTIHVVS